MSDDLSVGGVGNVESPVSSKTPDYTSPTISAPSSPVSAEPKGKEASAADDINNRVTNPQDQATISDELKEDPSKSAKESESLKSSEKPDDSGKGKPEDSGKPDEKSVEEAQVWFNDKLKSLNEGGSKLAGETTNMSPTAAGQTADKGAPTQAAAPIDKPGAGQPKTSLDKLISMFKDTSLPGKTAQERMQYVLDATRNGSSSTHFDKDAYGLNDSGFNKDFQDGRLLKNPELSNNQVGHFLTAVDCASTRGPAYYGYQRAAIGHEKTGDKEGGAWNNLKQTWQTTHADVGNFESAIESAKAGKKDDVKSAVAKILTDIPAEHDPWPANHPRRGNSHQDLALTAYGYALEQKIQDGSLATAQDVAQWLEKNLK